MLSFIDPTTVPPGGFKYLQKETNTILHSHSFSEVLHKVKTHRLGNNLPMPSEWKSEVENAMCEKMPPGICRHVSNPTDYPVGPMDRRLTITEAINGAKILGAWMLKGFAKVSQQEADGRSKTCAACPFNQQAEGCTTCASNSIREAVEGVLGTSKSEAHDSLHTCQICGCTLKVAVWVPQYLLDKHKKPAAGKPAWCWA
jgi:hypothetical protein